MYMMLATTKATETFNADYYIAIITILPIMMVAIEVLANFNKSIPTDKAAKLPLPVLLSLTIFYLLSPIIACVGIILGVLALIYKNNDAVYQWITFSCLVGVLGFLAISSTVYLAVSDLVEDRRERKEAKTNDTSDSRGSAP